jgi:hypothetical protein
MAPPPACCVDAAVVLAKSFTTSRGANLDDSCILWTASLQLLDERSIPALFDLIAQIFLAKAFFGAEGAFSVVAAKLATVTNPDDSKRFTRATKSSGFHFFRCRKSDTEGEEEDFYAKVSPAASELSVKCAAPFLGARYITNKPQLRAALEKAVDDVHPSVESYLLVKYQGEDGPTKLVDDLYETIAASDYEVVSKEHYQEQTTGSKGKRGKPCPPPPKKLKPTTATVVPENNPAVTAMRKATAAVIADPASATMMVATSIWMRKDPRAGPLLAAPVNTLTPSSKGAAQVMVLGMLMKAPLDAYNAGRASMQPVVVDGPGTPPRNP